MNGYGIMSSGNPWGRYTQSGWHTSTTPCGFFEELERAVNKLGLEVNQEFGVYQDTVLQTA